jgi:predicted CXXCH cytochrome family protein
VRKLGSASAWLLALALALALAQALSSGVTPSFAKLSESTESDLGGLQASTFQPAEKTVTSTPAVVKKPEVTPSPTSTPLPPKAIPTPSPQKAPFVPVIPTPSKLGKDSVRVKLAPQDGFVAPGGSAVYAVTIDNLSDQMLEVNVEISDSDPEHFTSRLDKTGTLKLAAKSSFKTWLIVSAAEGQQEGDNRTLLTVAMAKPSILYQATADTRIAPVNFHRSVTWQGSTRGRVSKNARIEMKVFISPAFELAAAELIDNFPLSWELLSAKGAQVEPGRLTWDLGDVSAGSEVVKSYILQAPSEAGSYTFQSELGFGVPLRKDAQHGLSDAAPQPKKGLVAGPPWDAIVMVDQFGVGSPHADHGAESYSCAACHRAHTGVGPRLRDTWPEESLCYTCHDGTGANTDLQTMFAMTYKHTITSTTGLHQPWENNLGSNWNPSTNRHVECEDCHEPHAIEPPTHSAGTNTASGVITGTWGVEAGYSGSAWVSPTFTATTSMTKEYELCFKCHSSYAYGSSAPTSQGADGWSVSGFGTLTDTTQTDQAIEFNPNNYSYHPVFAQGQNQPPIDANSNWPSNGLGLSNTFRTDRGWYYTSTIQCSDCHGPSSPSTQPEGPHGSNYRFMLRQNETGTGTSNVFCYNCHKRDVYGDGPANYNPPDADYSRWGHDKKEDDHQDPTLNRWGIGCLNCHGGDGMFWNSDGTRGGGIHGSNRPENPSVSGDEPLGKRMMNGAALKAYKKDTCKIYGKGSSDAVNKCTRHSGGVSAGCNYTYW